MADQRNFLLGRGESMIKTVAGPGRVPKKAHPYPFAEAVQTVSAQLKTVATRLDEIPKAACPNDQAVAALRLHPAYLAKSYFPDDFLRKANLKAVGSRPVTFVPRREVRKNKTEGELQLSTQIFVAGKREDFTLLPTLLSSWSEESPEGLELREIEDISAFTSADRLQINTETSGDVYEIVLHRPGRWISDALEEYARTVGATVLFDKSFLVKGLQFLPVRAGSTQIRALGEFSFLRVIRNMPTLRAMLPTITRVFGTGKTSVRIPTAAPVDPSIRVAVFDAGMPDIPALAPYVDSIEPNGIGAVVAECQEHGLAVTSALLFGPLTPGEEAPLPFAKVTHYRVVDANSGRDPVYLYDMLRHIDDTLRDGKFDFANISVGPEYPFDDGDIHPWTAVLDERLSTGNTIVTIAAGNTGEGDRLLGLHKIQVPADCVNAIAVGACDSPDGSWKRALWSSMGPGRSPGVFKPDGLSFGGTIQRPFLVLSEETDPSLVGVFGTSFAAPYALRSGIGVRALLGKDQINALAIRALLIHHAEDLGHHPSESGWGRFLADPNDMITCEDGAVHVLYQGEIAPAQYQRAPIPLPSSIPNVRVEITATVCFASDTDPQDPLHYTRSGIDVLFCKDDAYVDPKGSRKRKTRSFFRREQRFDDELTLRIDAHKWEPVVRQKARMLASLMRRPYFELHHNARRAGGKSPSDRPIRFALVVSIKAPKVRKLYDLVLAEYKLLQPLRPVTRVQVRT